MASEIRERNALAELAHTLCGVVVDNRYYATVGECIDTANAIGKARLIIAELAKVKGYDEHGQTYMIYRDEIQSAYEKCRAIAAWYTYNEDVPDNLIREWIGLLPKKESEVCK